MGVQANLRVSSEKGLFPKFSGFPRNPLEKAKKAEKERKRPILADFQEGRQTPLKPTFVTPPSAAAQLKSVSTKTLLLLELLKCGQSNLVDCAERPEFGLVSRGLGGFCSFCPGKLQHTNQSQNVP